MVSAFGSWLWDGSPDMLVSTWSILLSQLQNFVSVTPSMGVLFPLLRRGIVSTLQSSFFLSFMCLGNCILYLGYPRFWANIHLSVSTYCVSSFVNVLPHSTQWSTTQLLKTMELWNSWTNGCICRHHPYWGNPFTKEAIRYALTDKWILAQKLRIPKIQDTIYKTHETQEERRSKRCGHFAPS